MLKDRNAYPDKQFSDSEKFELCRNYKNAQDQSIQIDILSDLNLCSRRSIEAVLEEAHLLEASPSKTTEQLTVKSNSSSRINWDKTNIAKLVRLYESDTPRKDIANIFNCSQSCIANAIHRFITGVNLYTSVESSKTEISNDDLTDSVVKDTAIVENSSIQPLWDMSSLNKSISQCIEEIRIIQSLVDTYSNVIYDGTAESAHRQGMIIGEIRVRCSILGDHLNSIGGPSDVS